MSLALRLSRFQSVLVNIVGSGPNWSIVVAL